MSEAYKLAVIRYGDEIVFRSNKSNRIVRAVAEGFRTEHGQRLVLIPSGTIALERIISRTRPQNLCSADTIVFDELNEQKGA